MKIYARPKSFIIIFLICIFLTPFVLAQEEAGQLLNKAHLSTIKGDWNQAISKCNEAIKIDPRSSKAYWMRGNAYFYKSNYDQAISDYTQAIKIEPQNAEFYFFRGKAYFDKGKDDQAISDYTQAIKIEPQYGKAHYNRAVAYFFKQEYEKAWQDVHAAEALGATVDSDFLSGLQKASGMAK